MSTAHDQTVVTVEVNAGTAVTSDKIPTVATYQDGDYDVSFAGWDKDITMAINENTEFTATTTRTFVSANYDNDRSNVYKDYTGFNDAKKEAEDLINNNDLSDDIVKKLEQLVKDGYKADGSQYGRTEQSKVDNAEELARNYISALDKDNDGKVDDEFLKKYTVTFMVGNATGARVQVKKGESAKYPADASVKLEKAPTADVHYIFTGFVGGTDGSFKWMGDTVTNVTENMTVYATFVSAAHTGGKADCKNKAQCSVCSTAYGELGEHNYVAVPAQNATCTNTGCTAHEKCSVCGKIRGNANETSALGHSVDFTKPYSTETSDDSAYTWKTYKCVRCDYKEVVITIIVVDEDGNPVNGATVEIGDQKGTTDENGEFTINPLPDGEYNIKIEETDKQLKGEGTITVKDGNVSGTFTDGSGHLHKYNCNNCLCHKNNIFGKILRWICTLLSVIFRRHIKCCSDMEWYGGLIKWIT